MWFESLNFTLFAKKFEYIQGHERLQIGNCTVIFSERSYFRKANSFFNLTQFQIIDLTQIDVSR